MSKSMKPAPPRLTFVVPVLDDAIGLDRCLRGVAANTTASYDIETIVVDNGSQDDSAGVARRHLARVLTLSGEVAQLRNAGAGESSGEVLAFVDADNEISAGWVAAAMAA